MNKRAGRIQVLFGLIIVAVGLFSFVSCTRGDGAPDFTLPTIYGDSLSLSDYKGKAIILDFWATWCPPCVQEIPDFIELYNKYKDKGLVIIGVSLDRGSVSDVKSFCEDIGIDYPIVMGNDRVSQKYGGIRGIPTTFIIDRDGMIVNKFVGYRPPEVFEAEVKKLLSVD